MPTLPANQTKLPVKQEETDRIVKSADTSSRDDAYHMIPIDRKEQNRQEIEQIAIKNLDDEQQSKIKKENDGKIPINNNNNQDSLSEDLSNNKPSREKNVPTINHIAQNDE